MSTMRGAFVALAAMAAAVVWSVWSGMHDGAGAAARLSPADARQQEILKSAIGSPGDAELGEMYASLNARHFSGGLPAMPVAWEPRLDEVGALANRAFALEGMFGRIGKRTIILLHPKLRADAAALRRTLAHEMVHAWLHAAGDSSGDHGPAFQTTLKRLADEGAFAGIVASQEERESLRAWIAAESARLDAERLALERDGASILSEQSEVERLITDLDARIAAANAAGRGWPPQHEIDAANARRAAYNDRAARANDRADRHRASVDALNREIERYNLMVAYPDGLDERVALRR